MHSEIEILDLWRDTEKQCRLAANYANKKQITLARYHLETALVNLTYLEREQQEGESNGLGSS